MAQCRRPLSTERVELADEPVVRRRRPGSPPTTSTRSTVPDRRQGRAARRLEPAAAGARQRRARRRVGCTRCRRTSSTPTSHGTTTTQQRVRLQPAARGRSASTRSRSLRHDAHARAAGRPRLGVPHRRRAGTGTAELAELPELLAEKLQAPVGRGRRLRPRHRPVQPVAHHPRVHRARDRARPGARLRGQLRRHVVRDLRQARHAAVRLARS